jgi:hypothetical protein
MRLDSRGPQNCGQLLLCVCMAFEAACDECRIDAERLRSQGSLPSIQSVSASRLAEATWLSSLGYGARVRSGKRVPHARHWATFQLVDRKARGELFHTPAVD